MRAAPVLAVAVVLAGVAGCGDEPAPPLVVPQRPADPAELVGTWTATQPGYRLRYVFGRDGTYRYLSVMRQKKLHGTSSFEIASRGTVKVRRNTLVLRPRSGTKTRRDPDDPQGDYSRTLEKVPQRYGWSVRGTGKNAKLTLTLGGALAVTYRRG